MPHYFPAVVSIILPSHHTHSGICVATSEVGSDHVIALQNDSKSFLPLRLVLWPFRMWSQGTDAQVDLLPDGIWTKGPDHERPKQPQPPDAANLVSILR